MDQIKILIADDVKINIEIIKNILEDLSFIQIVGTVKDGQEEYDEIMRLQPDIVFTDNKMPKMTGVDVIRLVSQSKLEKKPTFIIITGDSQHEIFNAVKELDVFDIVGKPFENDRIIKIIEEYKKYYKENQEEQENSEIIEVKKDEKRSLLQKIIDFLKS